MVKTGNHGMVKCLGPAARSSCNLSMQVECVSKPVTFGQCNVVLDSVPLSKTDPEDHLDGGPYGKCCLVSRSQSSR